MSGQEKIIDFAQEIEKITYFYVQNVIEIMTERITMQLNELNQDDEIQKYYGKDDADFLDVDPDELQQRLDEDPLYQQINKFIENMEVI